MLNTTERWSSRSSIAAATVGSSKMRPQRRDAQVGGQDDRALEVSLGDDLEQRRGGLRRPWAGSRPRRSPERWARRRSASSSPSGPRWPPGGSAPRGRRRWCSRSGSRPRRRPARGPTASIVLPTPGGPMKSTLVASSRNRSVPSSPTSAAIDRGLGVEVEVGEAPGRRQRANRSRLARRRAVGGRHLDGQQPLQERGVPSSSASGPLEHRRQRLGGRRQAQRREVAAQLLVDRRSLTAAPPRARRSGRGRPSPRAPRGPRRRAAAARAAGPGGWLPLRSQGRALVNAARTADSSAARCSAVRTHRARSGVAQVMGRRAAPPTGPRARGPCCRDDGAGSRSCPRGPAARSSALPRKATVAFVPTTLAHLEGGGIGRGGRASSGSASARAPTVVAASRRGRPRPWRRSGRGPPGPPRSVGASASATSAARGSGARLDDALAVAPSRRAGPHWRRSASPPGRRWPGHRSCRAR